MVSSATMKMIVDRQDRVAQAAMSKLGGNVQSKHGENRGRQGSDASKGNRWRARAPMKWPRSLGDHPMTMAGAYWAAPSPGLQGFSD